MTARYDGFVPGQHPIEGFGSGGFVFGGMSHRGSILASPAGVRAIAPTRLEDVDAAVLAPLLAEPKGAVEFVVLGCGEALVIPSRDLRALFRNAGLRIDPMATRHAISTYNILLGEGRPVAALLIAAS
jgi:uncharacterized protein